MQTQIWPEFWVLVFIPLLNTRFLFLKSFFILTYNFCLLLFFFYMRILEQNANNLTIPNLKNKMLFIFIFILFYYELLWGDSPCFFFVEQFNLIHFQLIKPVRISPEPYPPYILQTDTYWYQFDHRKNQMSL